MPKLFDLQLARELAQLDDRLSLSESAAALNRRGFFTFTGLRWNGDSLRAARRHAASPRATRHAYASCLT